MKRTLSIATLGLILLCLPMLSRADETPDRTAIEAILTAINNHQPVTPFLTTETVNSPDELAYFTELEKLMAFSAEPMSEKLPPRFLPRSIRFITAEFALLEAENVQVGATTFRTTPVLFVMKKEGASWRIAMFRVYKSPFVFTSTQ